MLKELSPGAYLLPAGSAALEVSVQVSVAQGLSWPFVPGSFVGTVMALFTASTPVPTVGAHSLPAQGPVAGGLRGAWTTASTTTVTGYETLLVQPPSCAALFGEEEGGCALCLVLLPVPQQGSGYTPAAPADVARLCNAGGIAVLAPGAWEAGEETTVPFLSGG